MVREFDNTRALVVGLGRSGQAAARFLIRRGARVSGTDMQPASALGAAAKDLQELGVQTHLGGHHPALFLNQDLILVSPGVAWDLPPLVEARERGVEVVGEVELADRKSTRLNSSHRL